MLRLPPELHQSLVQQARAAELSLNQICLQLLLQNSPRGAVIPLWQEKPRHLIQKAQRHFQKSLIAVVAFGSMVSGENTAASDLDLLFVLDCKIPITRSLYDLADRWLQTRPDPLEINPHFVHLPRKSKTASGLWFEVALCHEVLFVRGRRLQKTINALLKLIEQGDIQRKAIHGHPYWSWSVHEE